jgi:hypothetical protein
MRIGRHLGCPRADGQALVLVALTLSVLVVLIVGVNAIALRRRTQTRIQDSLDQAAAAAVAQLSAASLVGDAPALLPHVEARFRAQLQTELRRVAAAVSPDPATLARQAQVTFVAAGGRCHGQLVAAPAVCADLTLTLTGVLGTPQVTFTTLAQATRQP